MTTTNGYRVIGTRPVRPDGIDKVMGRAAYAADIQLPQMLWARLIRSPHAHAIIKKIDASRALALPGVQAVVTAADYLDVNDEIVPGITPLPRRFVIANFLAVDKALFHGHPVAAVCATSPHIAEDAIALIDVEYEVLPPVMSAQRAMEPDAPILHPALRTREPLTAVASAAADQETNVASHVQVAMGDVEAAFAEPDVIVEGEFRSGTAHQGYIEPHSCTVQWNGDGSLVIYTSSQGSFTVVREQMATILRMPPSRIRVVPMEIGGGFGGKNRVYVEPIAAMLAKKTGKPVKLTMTREEVIQATGPTGGAFIHGRLGAKRDGTFVAGELWMAYEAGAFPGSSVNGGMNNSFGPYEIPNVRLDGYDVVVNRPRNAAYRAPGVPAPTFAVESLVDELAERLDIEPMELRQKNAAKDGTRRPTGVILGPNGNLEVMETIKNSAHYRSELSGENRGRGVAVGFWTAGAGQHSINAHVNSDGTVMVDSAAVDIGGLRATEAMTMAEVLGIPYDDVKTRILDTDSIGWTGITAGSGTGAGTSASVHRAGMEIRQKMIERAATIWEVEPAQVNYQNANGTLTGPTGDDGAERKLTFKEIARGMNTTGGFISGHADNGGATGGPTFSGHIVDIEVDPDTGKVTILRYTCVEDVGRALHPSYVEGQIQGGAAQGIGMALTEEYFYDEQGVLRNASLLDYRMPTTLDVPMIDTILIEVPNAGHPYGVRGVGEPPIVPPMGAIANAIYAATGVRVHSMPATPRHLFDALSEQNKADRATRAAL